MKRILLISLVAVLLALFIFTGCSRADKIGDILKQPLQYEGKEVLVNGTVGNSAWISLLSAGRYEVGDETGTIWIKTTQPPPQQGTKVSVKGTVSTALKLGDLSLGIAITETQRK